MSRAGFEEWDRFERRFWSAGRAWYDGEIVGICVEGYGLWEYDCGDSWELSVWISSAGLGRVGKMGGTV